MKNYYKHIAGSETVVGNNTIITVIFGSGKTIKFLVKKETDTLEILNILYPIYGAVYSIAF